MNNRFIDAGIKFAIAMILMMLSVLPASAQTVSEAELVDPALKLRKLYSEDLYTYVFSWLFHKYHCRNYQGQGWQEWEHKFEGTLTTEGEALVAIRELLASRVDPSLELLFGKQRKSAEAGCTVANRWEVSGYFVDTIIKDSPAARAGIHLGDLIKQVDSIEMKPSLSPHVAQQMLSGPPGKTIIVQVDRFSGLTDIPVTLTDADPEPQSYCALLKGNLAYLKPAFPLTSSKIDNIKTSLTALKQSGAVGLILDLRANGEDMSDVSELCGCFVGTKPAYGLLFRGNTQPCLGKGTQLTALPMVALIDDHTNTAAQALAACLKTNKRASLIGETTKGNNVRVETVMVDREYRLVMPINEFVTCEDPKGLENGHVEPDIQEVVYGTEIVEGPWWNVSIGGNAPSPLDGKDVQLELAASEIAFQTGVLKGPQKLPRRSPTKPQNKIYY